jgi:hypothetical protein
MIGKVAVLVAADAEGWLMSQGLLLGIQSDQQWVLQALLHTRGAAWRFCELCLPFRVWPLQC